MSDEPWVGLTEAVRQLRTEITAAMAAAEDEPLRFALGAVEVELALTMRRTVHGQGGVTFAVASVGAAADRARESTHRLTLTLTPTVGDTHETAYVAGRYTAIPER
ncbi:hypothetical protein Val02_05130 [Virgisporangium aliadipatigenens]|uniref:Trypsin-co-occurring domain-containing protein n=1 Tax=Virgisporangium aliadipatigenens TaxID=741659 RepID=A0A8J3YG51_9ACTN|nr:trypco2 family protein [Virgisporangium aliadipatigenens]GIJ43627.1 hypothetical protein Val02_05130 [Virgisporangium aliadipatigenens]